VWASNSVNNTRQTGLLLLFQPCTLAKGHKCCCYSNGYDCVGRVSTVMLASSYPGLLPQRMSLVTDTGGRRPEHTTRVTQTISGKEQRSRECLCVQHISLQSEALLTNVHTSNNSTRLQRCNYAVMIIIWSTIYRGIEQRV